MSVERISSWEYRTGQELGTGRVGKRKQRIQVDEEIRASRMRMVNRTTIVRTSCHCVHGHFDPRRAFRVGGPSAAARPSPPRD